MCGIAGIINTNDQPVKVEQLHRMSQRIRHRGPDDEGYLLINQATGEYIELSGDDSVDEIRTLKPSVISRYNKQSFTIGLAHRRFSIIDLSVGGHQPLFDADRTCCVVSNSEIYNYVEVRDELQAMGHLFRSVSDTEVIVEAYKAWGTECFCRLNGMWAVVLYDFSRNILILCRDRLGKKPLYWTRNGQTVYFASEIKALLEIPEIDDRKAVSERAIYPYLVHGLRDMDNSTFFEGINSLPAASWAVLDANFPSNCHQYWHVPTVRQSESDVSAPQAAIAVRETLADAVRIRMRADVPWCVELSGGMDSSALASQIHHIQAGKLTAYTVRFPEKEWDEEPFARSVANCYGMEHRVIDSPSDNFWDEILPFTCLEEEPYHSPNLHTNQMIRRLMRGQGIKMVLNGAAGDELFAGYSEYFHQIQMDNLFAMRMRTFVDNAVHWSETSNAGKTLVSPLYRLLKRMGSKVLRLLRLERLKYSYINRQLPVLDVGYDNLTELLYSDITNTKIPYWLRSGDKTHMGIPIESRAPFLDYRMVELAFTLPTTYLIRHGWQKWIMRKALEVTLPKDVLWRRKKMGFPFPYESFSRNSRPIIQLLLQEANNPYVDLSAVTEARSDWRLISFLLWYELYFNDNRPLLERLAERCPERTPDCGFTPEFLSSCNPSSVYK